MPRGEVIVIGSGIIGLAHALTAAEAGYSVTVLERDEQPQGASVRNFGTLWPVGCVSGTEREQALLGVRRWRQRAAEAGFWLRREGSLSLACRAEAWQVLQEFAAGQAGEEFELLTPHEIKPRYPAVRADGLRGALFSPAEAVVHPPSAIAGLVRLAVERGVSFRFGVAVAKAQAGEIETGAGDRLRFDRLVIAAGAEMKLLFPDELAAAQVRPCRLQMMRTAPQPAGLSLGAILVSDLTLCHYPAFRNCAATEALRARLADELPDHLKWGVHVIAAQHADGSVVLGDSHEYGAPDSADLRADVEELILAAAREFLALPNKKIEARWHGTYLKSTVGRTQVVLQPAERVTMVTAMGGLGMTLSWGLAEQTIQSWENE